MLLSRYLALHVDEEPLGHQSKWPVFRWPRLAAFGWPPGAWLARKFEHSSAFSISHCATHTDLYDTFMKACGDVPASKVMEELMKEFIASVEAVKKK